MPCPKSFRNSVSWATIISWLMVCRTASSKVLFTFFLTINKESFKLKNIRNPPTLFQISLKYKPGDSYLEVQFCMLNMSYFRSFIFRILSSGLQKIKSEKQNRKESKRKGNFNLIQDQIKVPLTKWK